MTMFAKYPTLVWQGREYTRENLRLVKLLVSGLGLNTFSRDDPTYTFVYMMNDNYNIRGEAGYG
jgi:hypothetical protein